MSAAAREGAALPTADGRRVLARRLRTQQAACAALGSPVYDRILAAAAIDVEAGGTIASLLAGHEDDPGPSALGLRMLGAVHRLVLSGRAPALALHYPSAGGRPGPRLEDAFLSAVEVHHAEIRAGLDRPVQTNEVGRSAALLGGFCRVARRTGLPLRLLEVGTSAGLNLRFDRFRYHCGPVAFGPPGSPVDLGDRYRGGCPDLAAPVQVAERAGCDRRPVDPTTEDGALTLMSYVWPDMGGRRRLLVGALEVARQVPAHVDTAGAADWLEERLAAPVPGCATVVFHSVFVQYLDAGERGRVAAAIAAAGRAATAETPLAWLRMEPARRLMEVRLAVWPGGDDEHLADAGSHGSPVDWLAG